MDLKKSFPICLDESVERGLTTMRLDVFLSEKFPEVSRSRWARIISQNLFTVNGIAAKASLRLASGQVLDLNSAVLPDFNEELLNEGFNAASDSSLSFQKLNDLIASATIEFKFPQDPKILYEDDYLLVINKPAGLTVHPGAGVPLEETLVAWLIKSSFVKPNTAHLSWNGQVLEEARPGIVHRLDRGTSGCLVIAKDPKTHEDLAVQFAKKLAGRHYWAIAEGNANGLEKTLHRKARVALEDNPSKLAFRVLKNGKHSIAAPLGRDPKNRLRYAVDANFGKKAITHFNILAFDKATELEKLLPEIFKTFGVRANDFSPELSYSVFDLALETGRTHQIRVHLSFLGLPILGDALYGGQNFKRILLHAHTLHFTHPQTREEMTFHSGN